MDHGVADTWAPGNARPVGAPAPAMPHPRKVSRGATAAHAAPKPPQVQGDQVPAIPLLPCSVVPTTPGSRPHGTGSAPALEEVCIRSKGQGRGGGGEMEGRGGQGFERPREGRNEDWEEPVRTCRAWDPE